MANNMEAMGTCCSVLSTLDGGHWGTHFAESRPSLAGELDFAALKER